MFVESKSLAERTVGKLATVLRELFAYQQRAGDGLFTQIQYELLQCHGLIVDANNEVA